jgi:hypothetical protein
MKNEKSFGVFRAKNLIGVRMPCGQSDASRVWKMRWRVIAMPCYGKK